MRIRQIITISLLVTMITFGSVIIFNVAKFSQSIKAASPIARAAATDGECGKIKSISLIDCQLSVKKTGKPPLGFSSCQEIEEKRKACR